MSRTVRVSRRAQQDIRANHGWLRERSRAAADRWRDAVERAIAMLGETADRYPPAAEESEGRDLREMLHGRRRAVYRVVFELTAGVVQVMAVRHASQGPINPADLPPPG